MKLGLAAQVAKGLSGFFIVFASAYPLTLSSATLPVRSDREAWSLPLDRPGDGYQLTNALGGLIFDSPVGIASPPDETNRLFVVQRGGQIVVVTNLANPTKTLFMDLSTNLYSSYIEAGLLALTFHPGFATNGYFYVYRTLITSSEVDSALHDQLSRFEVSPENPSRGLVESELVLISQYDDWDTHNGGDLQFGPDGYLYLSLGDEAPARSASPQNRQPIDEALFGVILRIDVDKRLGSLLPNSHPSSTTNYAIPPDNPFIGVVSHQGQAVNPARVRTEIYAIGFRNPFRFCFDPFSGRLISGDVGGSSMEEINIVVAGGNYGFPYSEGTLNYVPAPPGSTFLNPVITYRHGNATNEGDAVIGGVVYQGNQIPQLSGRYIFGDNVRGHIWAANLEESSTNSSAAFDRLTADPGISAFGRDPRDNELLAVNYHSGIIKRLVYSPPPGPSFPQTLDETGLFDDLSTLRPNQGLLPYEIVLPFWSDHALKQRWFALPDRNSVIQFAQETPWLFPEGTVWVKHFDLELIKGDPSSARRLETRVLVKNTEGVYGVTYRWGDSLTNAVLVPESGMNEPFTILDGGVVRTQVWHYPSRVECLSCHTAAGGYALGFNTAQLNRDVHYAEEAKNQILAFSQAGYFQTNVVSMAELPVLAHPTNSIHPVGYRARSYLAVNCSQCHQPNGGYTVSANWDARLNTPLADSGLLGRIVVPHSVATSLIWQRVADPGIPRMPPIATSELDATGIDLLSQWINSFLREPWQSANIGDGKREGISSTMGSGFAICGSGRGIEGFEDGFHYLCQPGRGNGVFLAEVRGVFAADASAKAGIMVREGLAGDARNVSLLLSPVNSLAFQFRAETNGYTLGEGGVSATGFSLSSWLKVIKQGDQVTGYHSSDGLTWSEVGGISIPMQDTYWGLAVTAHNDWGLAQALFENVKSLTVNLATPATNTSIYAPGTIEMRAEIVQIGVGAVQVEFFANGSKVGVSTNAPYMFIWSNAPAGDYALSARVTESSGDAVVSQPVNVSVLPAESFAAFVGTDVSASGDWMGRYGRGGYVVVEDGTNLPPFAVMSVMGQQGQTWGDSLSEPRALQRTNGPLRIAASWNSPTNFTIDLILRRGVPRRVALYFLDWDGADQRNQKVEFLDSASDAVLDSQMVSSFANGKYFLWSVRGHFRIRITALGDQSAVLSGLFFDADPNTTPVVALIEPAGGGSTRLPAAIALRAEASDVDGSISRVEFFANATKLGEAVAPPFTFVWTNALAGSYLISAKATDNRGATSESDPADYTLTLPAAHAAFVAVDEESQGSWKGHYGADGFILVNHQTNLPNRIEVHSNDTLPYTWQEFTADPRGLERVDDWGRIATTWYGETMSINVIARAGQRERVAFYLLDWDTDARQVRIDAFDSATGVLLDSRELSVFSQGQYSAWSIRGSVQFRLTTLRGGNAVVSGIFFDPETNTLPDVLLTGPESGLELSAPALVKLAASASSEDGIRKVEFYAGGLPIGEVTHEPYDWTWSVLSGNYDVWAKATDNSGVARRSQSVRFSIAQTNADAVFVGIETNTAGTWKASYGREGYSVPGDATNSLFPAPITALADTTFVWNTFSTDVRALEYTSVLGRLAACWVAGPTSSIDVEVNLRDGRYHQAALYCLDWDKHDRVEQISLFDASDGRLLDSQSISNFYDGHYVRWNIRGHIRFNITPAGPLTAVVSGLFIDPVPGSFDAWKADRFPASDLQNVTVSGDQADPDADGLDNLMEYYLGLNPLALNLSGHPRARIADDHLTLTVFRNKAAEFVTLLVEFSHDLVTWQSGYECIRQIGSEDQGGFEALTFQAIPLASTNGAGFVRLRLSRY